MADQYDIFNFGGSRSSKIGLKLNAPNLDQRGIRPPTTPEYTNSSSLSEDHSSGSSPDSGDDSADSRRRRRRHHGSRKTRSMAASRLLKKSRPERRPDDDEVIECYQQSKKAKVTEDSPSPSPPPCTSPLPSPPPPGLLVVDPDNKSSQILNKANNLLNRLAYSTPSDFFVPDSSFESSPFTPPSSSDQKMNLRVRCKGKVHKYEVNKFDPFSKVIALLEEELSVAGDNKVLLSHKTATIAPADSPASLGLTTADFIDAVVLAESVSLPTFNDSQTSCGEGSNITIKVQTSNKSMKYSLAMNDPLEKAMVAFASELKLSMSKLKFSFDGEIIDPSQTAQDLDMENDDCIDVIMI